MIELIYYSDSKIHYIFSLNHKEEIARNFFKILKINDRLFRVEKKEKKIDKFLECIEIELNDLGEVPRVLPMLSENFCIISFKREINKEELGILEKVNNGNLGYKFIFCKYNLKMLTIYKDASADKLKSLIII